ncbi:MAG: Gfo/Idh/MocA family oxidoreductase [Planctomycetota bacterium]
MADKVKVGMIGLRGWGNIVRRALKQSETLELAAIWSRSEESIERSQRELPSKVCESYEALLAEPIDAVLIINPNFVHLEYALAAADAGKAVLIEKPMTNTVAEGKQMVDVFREKGLLLAVKHPHRFSPAQRKIKELIDGGELGDVLSFESYTSHESSKNFPPDRWKRDPVKCPAAPLAQLGVHYMDTAQCFFGDPVWVESHHRNVLGLSENVDCTVTTALFGDVPCTFHAHYVVPGYQRLAVYGHRALVVRDGAAGFFGMKREGEKEFEPIEVENTNGVLESLEAFGRAMQGVEPFECPGEVGLLAVATCEAAIRSAAEDNRKVTIEEVMA